MSDEMPVTVPMLLYCPATAVLLFVQEALAPAANVPIAQMGPSLSSVTATLVNGRLAVLVTLYVHVTGVVTPGRIRMNGPGAESLSVPSVVLTILSGGVVVKL